MRWAIFGTGAIGGYYGGRLAAAGEEVAFIARGDHLAAIRTEGLILESPNGDLALRPVTASDHPEEIGSVDVVLLAVKTWQLADALVAARPLVGTDTVVITTQNGVEAPAFAAEEFGEDRVAPGVAKVFANIAGPGRIHHGGGEGSLTFAEYQGGSSDRTTRVAEAMRAAGISVVVPADVWVELWSKALFVIPFGTLGAATDASIGELRTDGGTRGLLRRAMTEVEAVARAAGVALANDVVDASLAFVDAQPSAGRSSLQRDLQAGVMTEIDAWTGAVVRLGEDYGVATPVHATLLPVLKLVSAQRQGRRTPNRP